MLCRSRRGRRPLATRPAATTPKASVRSRGTTSAVSTRACPRRWDGHDRAPLSVGLAARAGTEPLLADDGLCRDRKPRVARPRDDQAQTPLRLDAHGIGSFGPADGDVVDGSAQPSLQQASSVAHAIGQRSVLARRDPSTVLDRSRHHVLGAEAAYLTRLSRAYRSSPVVKMMLDHTENADLDGGLVQQGTRRP